MPRRLEDDLTDFTDDKGFRGKGALCVALVVTRHAKNLGLPLDTLTLVTDRGGQVLGLGRGAVQSILGEHGISRVLAAEGGRTSRGSLGNMRDYVALLNKLAAAGPVNLDAIEAYWVARVRDFFAAKPFRIKLDTSKGLRSVVRDVLAQAEDRQKTAQGVYYAGAVLQHLVGAKLECALGGGHFDHNSFSTSDFQTGRAGDFLIGDVAIHVTTSPSEALINKCVENLNDGLRPVVVTIRRGVSVAEGLAANAACEDRIDVFEIEQFVAVNLYELARFEASARRLAVEEVVAKYNAVVDQVETDPSLRIEIKATT